MNEYIKKPIECSLEEDRIELGPLLSFNEIIAAKTIFVEKYNAQDSEIYFEVGGSEDHESIYICFLRVIHNKMYQYQMLIYNAHLADLEQEQEQKQKLEREKKIAEESQKARQDFKEKKRLERIKNR